MYEYRVVAVPNVVDGDTLDVVIDLGFRMTTTQRLRLMDVDAPERGQAGWADATAFVRQWVIDNAGAMRVRTHKSDSFGRYLAYVDTSLSPDTLNQALLDAGHAKLYER